MTLTELMGILKEISATSNLPEFNNGIMAEMLVEQLAVNWDRLPDQARGTFLGIAAILDRNASAELAANEVVRKMRGP